VETLTTISVPLGQQSYSIAIGQGLHQRLHELYPARASQRGYVIASDNLAELFGAPVLHSLRLAGWDVDLLTVPDGESAKTIEIAGTLCRQLAQSGLDRGAVLFALGGGAVGDLVGFVASIYMRGIDFVQLPTTLLAQADASVGGKVAVDLPEGKNLVGAFHQPSAVFMDTHALRTLPVRHLRAGMAEVVKHAVIADIDLFSYIESQLDDILAVDAEALKHLLARNCQIKVDIVTQDPLDKGVRSLLNLGHTIGHAVEAATEEWEIHHGEAVAFGMLVEGRLAVQRGICAESALERLRRLLQRLGFEADVDSVDLEQARAALRRDKKIADGVLRLPLMFDVGDARMVDDVTVEQLDAVLCETLRDDARLL
jgi:3-dehydroquinate synthase